jgi:hypothetical protein
LRSQSPFSFGWPSTTIARIPRRASRRPQPVPAFDSLIPPVSGDFPPTEMRDDVGDAVPVTIPGEKTTLLFGPKG